jgi:hypothetical protein
VCAASATTTLKPNQTPETPFKFLFSAARGQTCFTKGKNTGSKSGESWPHKDIPAVKISLDVLRIPQLGAIFHLGKC